MRRLTLVVSSALLPIAASAAEPEVVKRVLSFDTMFGVEGEFLASGTRMRGIQGADLPRTIGSATGSLGTDGRLTIAVRGLVYTDDDAVPAELRGLNDDPSFRGGVSCLVELGNGRVRSANIFTPVVGADENGNADIDAVLELPDDCVAPVVLILSGSAQSVYAISGAKLD